MFTIEAIAIRRQRGAAMQQINQTDISTETGLADDAGRKPGKFMVTILSQESWADACQEVNEALEWTTRRANILISGYRFSATDVGKRITVGDCVLRITRETDPCDLMDEACPGLKQALKPDWRGGVRAQVEHNGRLAVGDIASLGE